MPADRNTERFGAGNFLFICLERLLRMHMTVSLSLGITINYQIRMHMMWHQGHVSELVQPSADGRHLWGELDTHFKKVRWMFNVVQPTTGLRKLN